MKISAQVVLINEEGLVLGVSRKTDHNDMGLAGGKKDPDDKDEMAAAIREVKEETGLDIYDLQLVFAMHKQGYMGYTYLAKYSGEINHNEPHVVKWVPFSVIMQGSFGRFNELVAESLEDMGIHYKKIESKTLYDNLEQIMKEDELAFCHYEEMMENHEKYLRALLTEAEMGISDYSDSACEQVMWFYQNKYKESQEAEEKFMNIINSKIDLNKIKNIQGYTEFDMIEWDFKSKPWNYKIKFKPKDVAVSFWHADPKNIIYND